MCILYIHIQTGLFLKENLIAPVYAHQCESAGVYVNSDPDLIVEYFTPTFYMTWHEIKNYGNFEFTADHAYFVIKGMELGPKPGSLVFLLSRQHLYALVASKLS